MPAANPSTASSTCCSCRSLGAAAITGEGGSGAGEGGGSGKGEGGGGGKGDGGAEGGDEGEVHSGLLHRGRPAWEAQ